MFYGYEFLTVKKGTLEEVGSGHNEDVIVHLWMYIDRHDLDGIFHNELMVTPISRETKRW